jgi:hypothetical protein
MSRAALAVLSFLILLPRPVSAHEVPDDVKIRIFLKPEGNRMLILVRMPANAFIDILFPTLPESDWLDLKQVDGFAAEGARVWIADLLSLQEGKDDLPEPEVLAVRISRSNDASFNTFSEALKHINDTPLPSHTLLQLNDGSVDALLESPIRSEKSDFSFRPNFARVGVRVTTGLTFLTPGGAVRQFEYEGDQEIFHLNPGVLQSLGHFVEAGAAHYLGETDYLSLMLCVALGFCRVRLLASFATAFLAAQSLALIASFAVAPSLPWIPLLSGVLIAAAIVYMGVEVIVSIAAASVDRGRLGLAVGTGLIFGSGCWFGLQPIIQFGGAHDVSSMLAFNVGFAIGEISVLALLAAAVQCLWRFASAPRVPAITAAAVAIHLAWHRMIHRAHAISLVPFRVPVLNLIAWTIVIVVAMALLTPFAHRLWSSHRPTPGVG